MNIRYKTELLHREIVIEQHCCSCRVAAAAVSSLRTFLLRPMMFVQHQRNLIRGDRMDRIVHPFREGMAAAYSCTRIYLRVSK